MYLLQRRAVAAARSGAAARAFGTTAPAPARQSLRAAQQPLPPAPTAQHTELRAAALTFYRDSQRKAAAATRGRFLPGASFRLAEDIAAARQEARLRLEQEARLRLEEAARRQLEQQALPEPEGVVQRRRALQARILEARRVAHAALSARRLVIKERKRAKKQLPWYAPLPLPLPAAKRTSAVQQPELRDAPLAKRLAALTARVEKVKQRVASDPHALASLALLHTDLHDLRNFASAAEVLSTREARRMVAPVAQVQVQPAQSAASTPLPPPSDASTSSMSGRISPAAPFALLASASRASSTRPVPLSTASALLGRRSRLPPSRSAGASLSRRMHTEVALHSASLVESDPGAPDAVSAPHVDSAGSESGEKRRAVSIGPPRDNRVMNHKPLSYYFSEEGVPTISVAALDLTFQEWKKTKGATYDFVMPAAARPYFKLPQPALSHDVLSCARAAQQEGLELQPFASLLWRCAVVVRRTRSLSGLPQGNLLYACLRHLQTATQALIDTPSAPPEMVASAIAHMQADLKQYFELEQKRAAADSEFDETAALSLPVADSVQQLRKVAGKLTEVRKHYQTRLNAMRRANSRLGKKDREAGRALAVEAAAWHVSRARNAADRLEKGERVRVDAGSTPLLPPSVAAALKRESVARKEVGAAQVSPLAADGEAPISRTSASKDAAEQAGHVDVPDQEPRKSKLSQAEARTQRRDGRLPTSREPRVATSQSRLAAPRGAGVSPMARKLDEQAAQYRAAALRAAAAAKELEEALARKTAAEEALATVRSPSAVQNAVGATSAEPSAGVQVGLGTGGSWGPDALAPAQGASGIALSPMTADVGGGEAHERRAPPHLAVEQTRSAVSLGRQRVTAEPVTQLYDGAWIEALRVVRPKSSATPSKRMSVVDSRKGKEEQVLYVEREKQTAQDWETLKWREARGGMLESSKLDVRPVEPLREMQVPRLAHNLSRVLFNPGVHWLREPRTGIYNFDPALRHIADVDLFDYDSLPPYVTSSADPELAKILKREGARYSGSTSSLTGALSQIYFHLSHWRQPDFSGFSEGFAHQLHDFGAGARLPASIKLRKTNAPGEPARYAVDQDKSASGEVENSNYILTQLGKALENFFTKSPEEYAKHLRLNSHTLTPDERSRPEAYHYARSRSFVMRSQLDCSDARLPRRTFDLKTRAVAAVRQDRANWVEAGGYAIRQLSGAHESFEREMYDLVRSAFLKYYFQARIGHMDGIFLAYHSTSSIFGFQYVPLEDMARRLFGDMDMAEQAFRLSVALLEELLDAATDFFPDEPLKITFDTASLPKNLMNVFVEPDRPDVSAEPAATEGAQDADASAKASADAPRTIVQLQVLLDRYLDGQLVTGPVDFSAAAGRRVDARTDDEPSRRARAELPPVRWDVEWAISPCESLSEAEIRENLAQVRVRQSIFNELSLPNIDALNARDEQRLQELAENPEALARFKAERAAGTAAGMPTAPGQTSEAAPPEQREVQWKKATRMQLQLRKQARLAFEDKLQWDKEDKLQMWLPDSPFPAPPAASADIDAEATAESDADGSAPSSS